MHPIQTGNSWKYGKLPGQKGDGPKHAADSSLNDLLGEQTVTVQREGGISSAEIIWHGYNVAVFTKHYYD